MNTEDLDNTVKALKFQPDNTMKQDKNGTWRYKSGTLDEFGNKIGGLYVKNAPSPNPSGRNGREVEILEYFREVSMDAAEAVYNLMMDNSRDAKTRLQAAEIILNRSLGRPKTQVEVTHQNPNDIVRPIVVPQSVYDNIEVEDD